MLPAACEANGRLCATAAHLPGSVPYARAFSSWTCGTRGQQFSLPLGLAPLLRRPQWAPTAAALFPSATRAFATRNQLLGRGARKPKFHKDKRRAFEDCPQKKGVCVRVYTVPPKKPNSANRPICKVGDNGCFAMYGRVEVLIYCEC